MFGLASCSEFDSGTWVSVGAEESADCVAESWAPESWALESWALESWVPEISSSAVTVPAGLPFSVKVTSPLSPMTASILFPASSCMWTVSGTPSWLVSSTDSVVMLPSTFRPASFGSGVPVMSRLLSLVPVIGRACLCVQGLDATGCVECSAF